MKHHNDHDEYSDNVSMESKERDKSRDLKQGRKPTGVSFETWVERQIREAMERGEFDNLPGSGKPLRDLDKPYDESWWLKKKMRSENLSYLPPTLALRKEAEEARRRALRAGSESEVRRIVTEINAKILGAIKNPLPGPPLNLVRFDVERIVREWRERTTNSHG